MTPNPIRKVLSTMQRHGVRCLLMGGQACVLYGAAEFSRDTDFVLLANPGNLRRLRAALRDLQAEPIAVPSLTRRNLLRGHAVHFRCRHPEARGLRIDLMAVLRNVPPFPSLWRRRTTVEVEPGERYEVMALPDLVLAKKTQRDKDWPMIRRLVEASYFGRRRKCTVAQMRFWLREARTPAVLIALARRYPALAKEIEKNRALLAWARARDAEALAEALRDEERRERAIDQRYWAPLRRELERFRHAAVRIKR